VIVLSSSSKKSPKKKSNKLAPKNINKSTKDAYKSVDLITALFH
jgi:hypothetical protein